MNVKLLGQFGQRLLALEGGQGHLRLKDRAVVPAGSFTHALSCPRHYAAFRQISHLSQLSRFPEPPLPHADADRQFVKILGAVLDHGLAAVEAACVEALDAGVASADVILTVLARNRQPAPPPSITTPDALRLKIEPVADCGRYDRIRNIA
jgi:hypothetical protein